MHCSSGFQRISVARPARSISSGDRRGGRHAIWRQQSDGTERWGLLLHFTDEDPFGSVESDQVLLHHDGQRDTRRAPKSVGHRVGTYRLLRSVDCKFNCLIAGSLFDRQRQLRKFFGALSPVR
jgi:hypothetical protein